jgi:hypothetical protein
MHRPAKDTVARPQSFESNLGQFDVCLISRPVGSTVFLTLSEMVWSWGLAAGVQGEPIGLQPSAPALSMRHDVTGTPTTLIR